MERLSENRQTTNRGELPQYHIMDTYNTPNVTVHHQLASKGGLNPSPTTLLLWRTRE
jgi:ABC-type hemin transport system substrate-binding protein